MKAMAKIVGGLVAIGLIVYGVEYFLSPLPHLSPNVLMDTPIEKLTLLFEAVIVIVVISGFVFQELVHHCHKVFRAQHPTEGKGARWADLLFALVAIFGSAALYVGFIRMYEFKPPS